MGRGDFDNVRLLLGETNPQMREAMRNALARAGVGTIEHTDRIQPVEAALHEGEVDLLVTDFDLPGGSVADLTRRLRHHEIGTNPFVVVVVVAAEPTPARVKEVVDSGADDLILKPLSPATLVERVTRLAEARKKFVVTTDYVGPDRRKGPRPGSQEIPLLDVPNPLTDRQQGDTAAFQRAVDAAARMINEQKVERHAFQISYLIEKLVPMYVMEDIHDGDARADEVRSHVERLIYVAEDISRRLRTSKHTHIAELCHSVRKVANRLREDPLTPNHKDVQLLPELGMAIRRAFTEAEKAVPTAYEISESVSGRGP